jgi:hypothetical protein
VDLFYSDYRNTPICIENAARQILIPFYQEQPAGLADKWLKELRESDAHKKYCGI